MRKFIVASVMALALSGAVVPLATVEQQNTIAKKKSCTPDACIKMVRQKGFPFATAASWCAANNNGC
jgi:hypothetical protein